MRRAAGIPLAAALALALDPGAAAAPLVLEPGTPTLLTCETQAVVVAPEAASTKGSVRLKLEPQAVSAGASPDSAGRWTILDVSANHAGSLGHRHSAVCAGGCALQIAQGKPAELWAPRRVAPASLAAGEAMTVATIEIATGRLRASTFIDNAIAALEQGVCTQAAP